MNDDSAPKWRPATVEEVKEILQEDLAACDDAEIATFKRYAVEPYHAPISRYGASEFVVVVARRQSEAIYWDDVEEGFSVSSVGDDGEVLYHFCNQDHLGLALNAWSESRKRPQVVGPAIPLK